MPILVQGNQSSVNALAANQMPENDRLLYLLYPFQYPLFQKMYFSTGRRAEPVYNDKGLFNWYTDELYPYFATLTGAGIAGGSATENIGSVINTAFIMPNDLLLIESTGQLVYCTTITPNITISTMNGTDLISASAAGNCIRKVGTLDHEFAGLRTAVSTVPVQVSNYLTKFNESVGMTGRQQAGKTWTDGTSFKEQIDKKVDEMKLMYENNFKFSTASGIKTVTGSDGATYNATYGKGLLGQITTNIKEYTTITEDFVDNFAITLFNTGGSNVRDLYFGSNLSLGFMKIVKDKYRIDPKPITAEYGVRLQKWILNQGEFNLIWDPTMSNRYADQGFAIDPDARRPVKMRYMADDDKGSRKFRIEKNVQTPGTDGRIDKFLADIGIQVPLESINGIARKAV